MLRQHSDTGKRHPRMKPTPTVPERPPPPGASRAARRQGLRAPAEPRNRADAGAVQGPRRASQDKPASPVRDLRGLSGRRDAAPQRDVAGLSGRRRVLRETGSANVMPGAGGALSTRIVDERRRYLLALGGSAHPPPAEGPGVHHVRGRPGDPHGDVQDAAERVQPRGLRGGDGASQAAERPETVASSVVAVHQKDPTRTKVLFPFGRSRRANSASRLPSPRPTPRTT
jgi:hypothetical protein